MTDEDEFWAKDDTADGSGQDGTADAFGREGSDPDAAVSGSADAERPTSIEEAALAGFIGGGLGGLLAALDAREGASFEDEVEDPEALRRAEEAVAHDAPERGPRETIDEPWSVVATQDSAGDNTGLDLVVQALQSDGIDVGWDPYDPRDTVNFMPPSAGLTARKLFSVVVPDSQVERARQSLRDAPPLHGVTYVWPDMRPGGGTGPTAAPVTVGGFDAVPAPMPTPITSFGDGLSDNDRLEQLAGKRSGSGAAIVFAALVIVSIVAVAFLLMRG